MLVPTIAVDVATIASGMLVIPSAQRMQQRQTLLLFTQLTEVGVVVL